ncbi:MAG: zinc ribbon domain-containing protein [Oscillospiraceae bacterium]
MTCLKCGEILPENAMFCTRCGNAVPADSNVSPTIEFEPISQKEINDDLEAKKIIAEAGLETENYTETQTSYSQPTVDVDRDTAMANTPEDATSVFVTHMAEPQAMELPPVNANSTDATQTENKLNDANQPSPIFGTNPANTQNTTATSVPLQPYTAPFMQAVPTAVQNPEKTISLPKNVAPLSMVQYILCFLIMAVPVVNIVVALVWSFSTTINLNRRNFARATLLLFAVFLCLAIIALSVAVFMLINSPSAFLSFFSLF